MNILGSCYDKNNVFAKILRAEAPSTIQYFDQNIVVINDIFPNRKTHLLAIPRLELVTYTDLLNSEYFFPVMGSLNVFLKRSGLGSYTLLVNSGSESGQVVPHLHFHIMSDSEYKPLEGYPLKSLNTAGR